MLPSVKALLSSVVDYAGLFPPAKLNLPQAMANYAQYQMTPHSWMLGRFILPASRWREFEELLATWEGKGSLSVILSGNWQSEIEKVVFLNQENQIAITALEFPPLPPREIEQLLPHLPAKVDSFFEIPLGGDWEAYLTVIRHKNAAAKIRTGGITADAFPSVTQLCQCMFAFAQAQISFKATAGLHHPLPASYPLTYELDSPHHVMHGFLNVVILAALIYWQKVTPDEAIEVLNQSSSDAFQFQPDAILWNNHRLSLSEIEQARNNFFRSFGSCSFQEPIDDLKKINLLNG